MNKRIKELAKQAGMIIGDNSEFDMEKFMPKELKFAELIIQECASMARVFQAHEYNFTGDLDLDKFMLKHFGVEE